MNKKHKEDLEQQLAKFHEVFGAEDVHVLINFNFTLFALTFLKLQY